VKKEVGGAVVFEEGKRNLVKYDDYVIDPEVSPTDIACQK
jgi:hypothetical protein